MAHAPVRADLAEALDRLLALTAQVALDLEIRVDVVAKLRDLAVGEVADLGVTVDGDPLGDLARRRAADAEDVRERDLEPLLTGKIYAGDACHLALPLLVAGGRAKDPRPAGPPCHPAPPPPRPCWRSHPHFPPPN